MFWQLYPGFLKQVSSFLGKDLTLILKKDCLSDLIYALMGTGFNVSAVNSRTQSICNVSIALTYLFDVPHISLYSNGYDLLTGVRHDPHAMKVIGYLTRESGTPNNQYSFSEALRFVDGTTPLTFKHWELKSHLPFIKFGLSHDYLTYNGSVRFKILANTILDGSNVMSPDGIKAIIPKCYYCKRVVEGEYSEWPEMEMFNRQGYTRNLYMYKVCLHSNINKMRICYRFWKKQTKKGKMSLKRFLKWFRFLYMSNRMMKAKAKMRRLKDYKKKHLDKVNVVPPKTFETIKKESSETLSLNKKTEGLINKLKKSMKMKEYKEYVEDKIEGYDEIVAQLRSYGYPIEIRHRYQLVQERYIGALTDEDAYNLYRYQILRKHSKRRRTFVSFEKFVSYLRQPSSTPIRLWNLVSGILKLRKQLPLSKNERFLKAVLPVGTTRVGEQYVVERYKDMNPMRFIDNIYEVKRLVMMLQNRSAAEHKLTHRNEANKLKEHSYDIAYSVLPKYRKMRRNYITRVERAFRDMEDFIDPDSQLHYEEREEDHQMYNIF